MSIIVRPTVDSDIQKMEQMSFRVQEIHAKLRPNRHNISRMSFDDVYGENLIHNDNYTVLVADSENQELVGYAICRLCEFKPPFPGQEAYKYIYLHEIGISEEHQNQGIGQLLLDKHEQIGKANRVITF